MRAVLDVNVIVSALLSPQGTPAKLLRLWTDGAFEVVASPLLLAELERALAYPKVRKRITPDEARLLVEWLERSATVAPDPKDAPAVHSPDPGDDYLIALAAASDAVLVTGDTHLLGITGSLPIKTPADFLQSL